MCDYGFEMPTPCQKCGKTFELNDGGRSEKWFPGTTICINCWEEEQIKMERDEEIIDLQNSYENAVFDVKEYKKQLIEKEAEIPQSDVIIAAELWIDRTQKEPEKSGCYTVYGCLNAGTKHAINTRFSAYWDDSQKAFCDKDGEDLTGINESVSYWLDDSQIPNPDLPF